MPNQRQEQRIRERAYAIYLARQGHGGSAIEDWLRAERELADTIRAPRPTFQTTYGGDGISSGPEPEAPDPASLQDVAPTRPPAEHRESSTPARGGGAQSMESSNSVSNNARRRQ